jgi:hypothetical protein
MNGLGDIIMGDISESLQNVSIKVSNFDDNIILYGGNVGVNKTNPQYALDVTGDIQATKFRGDGSLLTNLPSSGSNNLFEPTPTVYKQKYDFESTTAGYTTIWVPTAIASGTAPVLTAFDWKHQGLINVTLSSGTAGSGYAFAQSNAGAFRLTNSSYFYAVFYPQCQVSSVNITENRIGYQDVFTATKPVDGFFLNVSLNSTTTYNFTLTSYNNSESTRGTTFSAPCNQWYSALGIVNTPNLGTLFLYDENKTLINTQTVTTKIPTQAGRETSSAVVTHMKGARYTTLGATVYDYFEIGVNASLVR